MKKQTIGFITLLSISSIGLIFNSSKNIFNESNVNEINNKVEAYSKTKISDITEIDLNKTTDNEIREYYSSLSSNLKGNDLLKALKPILSNNQKYFSYDSGSLWDMYEITDRDWSISKASDLNGTNGTYDEVDNVIHNYKYGSSASNPYVRMLYRDYENYSIESKARAWDSHNNNNAIRAMNQEHVWPKSWGFEESGDAGARGDPHNLLPGDASVNCLLHNNYAYGNVDTTDAKTKSGTSFDFAWNNYLGVSSTLKELGKTLKVFEPQDSNKGDIARACFYMVARYNNLANSTTEEFSSDNPNLMLSDDISYEGGKPIVQQSSATKAVSYGILSDLLEWNHLDPVDEYERYRNDLIYNNYSHNRNPFIDFPDWADIAFGSNELGEYADPSKDSIHVFESEEEILLESINVEDINVPSGKKVKLDISFSPINVTNKTVTYEIEDESILSINSKNIVSGLKIGSCNVKASVGEISTTFKVNVYDDGETLIDFSNAVTTSSPNTATYKSFNELVSLKHENGNGSYVNLGYVDSPRFYKGHIFTFTAAEHYYIKKIDIYYRDNNNAEGFASGYSIDVNDNVVNDSNIDISTNTTNKVNSFVIPNELEANTVYVQNIESSGLSHSLFVDKIVVTIDKENNPITKLEVLGDYKKEYIVGESFDPSGIIVNKHYSKGEVVNITDEVEFLVPEFDVSGDLSVNVSYYDEFLETYFETSFTVKVYPFDVNHIEVDSSNIKEVLLGKDIDYSSLVVTAYYDNEYLGSIFDSLTNLYKKELSKEEYSIDESSYKNNLDTVGVYPIIVNYGDKASTSFDVEAKLILSNGEHLDFEENIYKATFASTSWKSLDTDNISFSGSVDGGSYNEEKGVTVTKGKTGLTLTSKSVLYDVSSVHINYCLISALGVNDSASIRIEIDDYVSSDKNISSTTLEEISFVLPENKTGTLKIITNTNNKSVYLHDVLINAGDDKYDISKADASNALIGLLNNIRTCSCYDEDNISSTELLFDQYCKLDSSITSIFDDTYIYDISWEGNAKDKLNEVIKQYQTHVQDVKFQSLVSSFTNYNNALNNPFVLDESINNEESANYAIIIVLVISSISLFTILFYKKVNNK